MAGIGFVLRKLYKQDNLYGLLRACLHSAFASTGPWLFTVLALGTISMLSMKMVSSDVLLNFRTILIYNFSFSLVISGPVLMVVTRYVADCIHSRDVSNVPGVLLGSLVLIWGIEIVISALFYFVYADLPFFMAISAVVNFLLVSAVWLVSIFVSALKNYQLVTRAFLLGMMAAVGANVAFAGVFGATGMLNGFSVGLSVIIALLASNILVEYPHKVRQPFAFMGYFRKYWEIALSGAVYNMAILIDKWIMWFAPEATKLDNNLIIYPHYDSAMFIAFMTTVPAMALFLFNTETNFFERYVRYYRDIAQKASFAKIQKNHKLIERSIFGSAGYFFLLQGVITVVAMLLVPEIVSALKGNYMQVGIMRYGLLGSFFQILTLFLIILLSYFDIRKASLYIQLAFLGMNVVFTIASMQAGFQYYGYGYFLASFFTFVIAVIVATRYTCGLPYHTFVTTNTSIN